MKVLYTAEATSVGGRTGHVRSSDGLLDFEVKVPAEMGGPGGAFTNPEQLFAATYSTCFNGAVMRAASNRKRLVASKATAKVSIGEDEKGGLKIAAEMNVLLPGIEQHEAEEIVKEAHQICPYSKAIRNNVEVTLMANGKKIG